jgi:hypothetical protein
MALRGRGQAKKEGTNSRTVFGKKSQLFTKLRLV